ncbi:MAG: Glu/Leu/Phe/Val dehydrogenase dimerization domain-containing protein [Bacteroidota bacterium]
MTETRTLSADPSGVMSLITAQDHEMVLHCQDHATGLKAIIAVHNTVLGPGLGGIRMWPYENEQAALDDVLRLSRGMTYKASAAGLNLGGGKSVIIRDAKLPKSEALLRRFGKFVDSLAGNYVAAEDVGMTEADMVHIYKETKFVTGIPEDIGGSGDPSPVTAYGVFCGIRAALKYRNGSDSLSGKKILVQGVGTVGEHLVKLLTKHGARVFIYDIYEPRVKEVVAKYNVQVADPSEVYTLDVDVFAPCALGAGLNPDTIPTLGCDIVAGAANNQLLDETRDSQLLIERGILYTPDFVINAGGIINISLEIEEGPYDPKRALELTEKTYQNTLNVFHLSEEQHISPHAAAMQFAEKRIQAKRSNSSQIT